jgi:hypothetical protein
LSRHPVPVRLASLVLPGPDRTVNKYVLAAQRRAIVARAEDAANREVIAGRMRDTAALTHYAADHGVGIAARVEAEAHGRPFVAAAVGRLGSTGIEQLERHLRSYGDS